MQDQFRETNDLQHSILEISEAALSAQTAGQLYAQIHAIIRRLIPTSGFYIALDDLATGLIQYPYFASEYEQAPAPHPRGKGLTETVLQTGKPLLASPEVYAQLLESGELEDRGAPSEDWLGIPLKVHEKTIGVLAIQNYTGGEHFGPPDQAILEFVSTQIAMAIERKRAEEALARERQLLRTVIDIIPDQIFVRDRNCRFTLNNRSDALVMGVTDPETLLGKSDEDFYPPDLAARYQADDLQVMASGQPMIGREEPSISVDGGQRWTLTTKVPLRDEQGQVTGLVGIARDITDRRRGELVMQEAKIQAEAANQAKSVFLANMSHEIRTPLNAILGFSQLMLNDLSLTARQRQYLNTINRSGEHLLGLINDILEISKIEAGRTALNEKVFDLRTLVEDIEAMFRVRTDGKQLWFLMEVSEDVPRFVLADEGKLRQILINLLGNAVKFTQEGGVALRVTSQRMDDQHARLVVEVEDTGPGIAEAEMGMLFQVFQQASAGTSFGGTGLGLAISQRFARLMGGDITVKSTREQGSCFHFEAVIQESEAGPLEHKAVRRKIFGLAAGQAPCRVLVADDKPENRELLCEILRTAGFTTEEAGDGASAVAQFAAQPPDLIVMDMRMPVMDGFEAIKRIRSLERGARIPIIAMTASAFEEDTQAILENGANGYLRKPFRSEELLELIGTCLKVHYAYDDFSVEAESMEAPEDCAPIAENIEDIPGDLIAKIEHAALDADLDCLVELVDQVRCQWPQTAKKMKVLADRLQYDLLLELIQKGEKA